MTVTTMKGEESYIVPSENAGQAVSQFNRPDAVVKASGNLWAQVTETDGESFSLKLNNGDQFYLEPGNPGYDRVHSAHNKLVTEIEQAKLAQYDID
ncbi:hypothetical protein [Stutzerimonas nitrititolerans]|uniref:hypothetical protein n=1 Tax=Stutzerimonas nitrititolerans TaxID=2482751 RepID=UPI0028A1A274|nr:hypothetical protein [Stutzerimonas nitrititolerans]